MQGKYNYFFQQSIIRFECNKEQVYTVFNRAIRQPKYQEFSDEFNFDG